MPDLLALLVPPDLKELSELLVSLVSPDPWEQSELSVLTD